MREVNFSIPNVNKASVGITTALYDRRALDCTSTLPLINSLNHLAYLTTSSARIREILTVDGGIERLVCILKSGRSTDQLGVWKWNLAFQCVVNIGVRGTEEVRTRVVEADLVPVIATILNNYIKIVEKYRERQDDGKGKSSHTTSDRSHHHHHHHHHHHRHRSHEHRSSTSRVTAGPIAGSSRRQMIPDPLDMNDSQAGPSNAIPPPPPLPLARPDGNFFPPTTTQHSSNMSTPERYTPLSTGSRREQHQQQAPEAAYPSNLARRPLSTETSASTIDLTESFVRPVREIDRLASMTPFSSDAASQPTSPSTPVPSHQFRSAAVRPQPVVGENSRSARRRPSIRHQNSITAAVDVEEMNADSMPSDEAPDTEMGGTNDLPPGEPGIQDVSVEDGDGIITGTQLEIPNPTASEAHPDIGTFNIPRPTPIDGSIGQENRTPTPGPQLNFSPVTRPTLVSPPQPSVPSPYAPRYLLERQINIPASGTVAVLPRDEDVLMSLQLLAYVSKYCPLRPYFQQSHLVPRLRLDNNLGILDGEELTESQEDIEKQEDEEYLLPNDFNLFPLIEKFTIRYHSTDMQYWAGVVMRNLCRKDDSQGGIRQCAYYQCGKWEEYTRQFAKCRRCRRTKYCSKECQKRAWAFHRHWCVATASGT